MPDPGFPERREPDPFDLRWIFDAASSPGPVNWEVAERLATSLAAVDPDTHEPRPDPPVTPETAGAIRGLVDAAQSYVSGATGLSTVLAVPVRVVTRAEWTRVTLHGLRPVLGALAEAVSPGGDPSPDPFGPGGVGDPMQGMLRAFAPMLFGVQAGTLVGMLSQYALGQYDLPLPLAGEPELAFIATNIESFTDDWSLPRDDLRFALALRESVHAAQRSVPWVRERLLRLAIDFVSRYELRPEAFEERFGRIDPSALDLSGLDLSRFDPATFDPATFDPTTFDPASIGLGNVDFSAIEEQLGGMAAADPGELLDAMRTAEQVPLLAELQRFGGVLAGYADIVVGLIGAPLIPELGRIDEALRRHRVERGRVASFVDQMLGLALDREHYDAGRSFCEGVVERAGLEGLNRIWEEEAMVPTPSEFEAPGLWLARIEL